MLSVPPIKLGKERYSQVLTSLFCLIFSVVSLHGFTIKHSFAEPSGRPLTVSQKAHVSRILSYLNRITTLQAQFSQTNPDGRVWRGTVSIQRPGNFRFDYDPPVPHTLISNGTWFIHIDRELRESNFLPLNRTPARFLLRKKVTFDRDVELVGFRRSDGLIHLQILNKEHRDMGSITLTFNEQPLALKQWFVSDEQDNQTLVSLEGTRLGLKLEPRLFEFVEPEQEDQDQ